MVGVARNLTKADSEFIKGMCEKFPALSYREALVVFKYVPKEKLEKALFQVNSFMTVKEYLIKLCHLRPMTVQELL